MFSKRSAMGKRVKAFTDRPRARLDTDIKNACTELTMDILRKMEPISDKVTYPNVARCMICTLHMWNSNPTEAY